MDIARTHLEGGNFYIANRAFRRKDELVDSGVIDHEKVSELIKVRIDLGEKVEEEGGFLTRMELVMVADVDGKDLWLPRLYQVDSQSRMVEKRGTKGGMTLKEKTRLQDCLSRYNLPMILATHLTFNRPEYDLSKLDELRSLEKPMVAYGLIGKPGDRKSATLAASAFKYGTFVANFDGFSEMSFERYLKALEDSGMNKDCKVEEIMEVILECRQKRKAEPRTGYLRNGRQVLDDLVTQIEERLEAGKMVDTLIACDMPGVVVGRKAGVSEVFCNAVEGVATIPAEMPFEDLPPVFLVEKDIRYRIGLDYWRLFEEFVRKLEI